MTTRLKERSSRNRTLMCSPDEYRRLETQLVSLTSPSRLDEVTDRILLGDTLKTLAFLPNRMADLVVLDPPYNLTKNYNGRVFRASGQDEYRDWFAAMLDRLLPKLKPEATLYVCSDWRTSTIIYPLLEERLQVRNRITWEREKGRGSKTNWKNNTEDVWFCTLGNDYVFNVDDVKLKRAVIAPYKGSDGQPKDWEATAKGNFRLTHPSNIWTDLTVPFWSMPENTDHPTQKPEKLIAKLILASTNPGQIVLDPFVGSGTSAVVAKKLGRSFCAIEREKEYCCWAQKRLELVEDDPSIQGYANGVFWERNSLNQQK